MLKKSLALVLSLALALSMSLVAMAETIATSGGTATGEGETEYLDTEKYSMILPTGKAFDFTLDPFGLLGVADGATGVTLDTLSKGKIIGGAPVNILNECSVPVKVTASITATITDSTSTASNKGELTASFVATNGVTAPDAAELALLVIPSKNDMPIVGTAGVTPPSEFVPTDDGISLSTTATDLIFALPAANYEVLNTAGNYSLKKIPETGHGTALKLGGYVNPDADWKEFSAATTTATGGEQPAKIEVAAVFTLAKDITTTASTTYDTTNAYALLPMTYAGAVAKVPSGLAPPAPAYSFTVTAPTFATVTAGYTAPAAQPITISTSSASPIAISSVALDTQGLTKFDLVQGTGTVSTGTNNVSYTIKPKAGLAVGTHSATITVKYGSGTTATATVNFVVSSISFIGTGNNGSTGTARLALTKSTAATIDVLNITGETISKVEYFKPATSNIDITSNGATTFTTANNKFSIKTGGTSYINTTNVAAGNGTIIVTTASGVTINILCVFS